MSATFTEKQLENFDRYERVRKSGRFNMMAESRQAQAASRLSFDAYWFVIENYSALQEARAAASSGDTPEGGA